MPPAAKPKGSLRDPFLLPVCDCGGPMNLASLEPHALWPDQEVKTYKCAHCSRQQTFNVRRRSTKPGERPQ